MSVFEYIFSLYSLLLGLALAHLLGGLAKVVEARDKVQLGWPTALLALQMMLSIAISGKSPGEPETPCRTTARRSLHRS
jgi:hypothetical protein